MVQILGNVFAKLQIVSPRDLVGDVRRERTIEGIEGGGVLAVSFIIIRKGESAIGVRWILGRKVELELRNIER